MLYRQFYQDADTSTLKQLYVYNITPHLENACLVWDPYLQKDIDMLEPVQNSIMEEYEDVFLENFNYYTTAHKGVNCDVLVWCGPSSGYTWTYLYNNR